MKHSVPYLELLTTNPTTSKKKPKIYLAGKFSAQERLREIETQYINAGYEVVSSWLHEPPGLDVMEYAYIDLIDLSKATLLILDTLDVSETGGRETELGFALAKGITVYRVGPQRHIFHSLVDRAFETQQQAFEEVTL